MCVDPASRVTQPAVRFRISVSAPHAEQRVSKLVVDFLADKERVNRLLLRQAPPELVAKIQARETELIESRHALGQALNPPPGKPRMPLAPFSAHGALCLLSELPLD